MSGGYDDGYSVCKCFWGQDPGSQLEWLAEQLPTLSGLRILDLGCGEGKNAIYCARLGAQVTAIDVSEKALRNAKNNWPATDYGKVKWIVQDAQLFDFRDGQYDIIIMYGLCHCLSEIGAVEGLLRRAQANTVRGGYNVLCAFNNRKHDLSAHSGFSPLLLPHEFYENLYSSWELLAISDADLFETHPHNNIPHFHSLTRAVTRRPD